MKPSNSQIQEARWVLLAQLGDRDALDLLLQSIQQPLLEFLRHRLGSTDGAEDCAQLALMQICRKLGSLREAQAIRPWMYRIASRLASKRFRDAARETMTEQEDAREIVLGTESECDPEELLPQLRARMQELPPNSSGVVFLHYMEGLSLTEISEVLNKPLGTIKSRLAYGLMKLRTQLKETRDE
jgi:RNA polymerase sigma-70 factor (ECF subfamily)